MTFIFFDQKDSHLWGGGGYPAHLIVLRVLQSSDVLKGAFGSSRILNINNFWEENKDNLVLVKYTVASISCYKCL